jgi:transcriptional regulator GlxA family with amidase domain
VMLYVPPAWVASTMGWPADRRPARQGLVWRDAGLAGALGAAVAGEASRLPALLRRILAGAGERAPATAQPPSDPRVDALCALLQDDDAAAPDLPALARRLGMSREHAHRLFRAAVGLTPAHYARLARITRAKAMLRDGKPAADVAAACGFADQPHFARWFRRCFGVTPSRYGRGRA